MSPSFVVCVIVDNVHILYMLCIPKRSSQCAVCSFFFVLCKSALCNRFLLSSALKNYLVSVFSFWCRQFSIPPLHRYFTCSSVLFAHLILCDVRLMSFETSNRVQVFLIGRIFFSAVSSYLLVMKCIFSATEKPNAW